MTPLPDYEVGRPTAYEWTDRAFELLLEQRLHAAIVETGGVRIAEASGECPRCRHDVRFSLELEAALPGRSGGLGGLVSTPVELPVEYVPVDVECRCGGDHPGRPEGVEVGCGILFAVEVLKA